MDVLKGLPDMRSCLVITWSVVGSECIASVPVITIQD